MDLNNRNNEVENYKMKEGDRKKTVQRNYIIYYDINS